MNQRDELDEPRDAIFLDLHDRSFIILEDCDPRAGNDSCLEHV